MTTFSIKKKKYIYILIAFAFTGSIILLEYINGNVVTHYLLADNDMPGFSNWWGLISIPTLTWVAVTLIEKREEKSTEQNLGSNKFYSQVLKRFFVAIFFGVGLSLLWELDLENILQYLILLPVAISLFKPIHYPEYFLGFVLGMLYTFGGILPSLIGFVLLILSFITNKVIRGGFDFVLAKFQNKH